MCGLGIPSGRLKKQLRGKPSFGTLREEEGEQDQESREEKLSR